MKPMRKSRNKYMAAQYTIKVIFQISRKKVIISSIGQMDDHLEKN